MIQIQVNSEMFAYDMYHITKAFFPGEVIEQSVDASCDKIVEFHIEENSLSISK